MKNRIKSLEKWNKKVSLKPKYNSLTALEILHKNPTTKFVAAVDLVFNLNLNAKKPEHLLKGFLQFPYPQVKKYKIAVFTEKFLDQATNHDLFLTGGKELVDQIAKNNKVDFNLALATPEMMAHLKKIGKLLGTKKLMPTEKMGTLGMDLNHMIKSWKKGRSTYQVDNTGNLHFKIGQVTDKPEQLLENFNFCLNYVLKIKPNGVKGKYIKSIHLSSTMSPSLNIDWQV